MRSNTCACTSQTCDARSRATRSTRSTSSPSQASATGSQTRRYTAANGECIMAGGGSQRFPIRANVVTWLVAFLGLAAAALALSAGRPRVGEAHVALVLLLVVLAASAAGGRTLGITIAF